MSGSAAAGGNGGIRCDDLLKSLGIPFPSAPRPRAPPRFIRPPSPLIMERPQPVVPDVSLIIDSASTSFHSNADFGGGGETSQMFESSSTTTRTTANNSERSPPTQQNNTLNSEISPGVQFVNYIPTPPVISGTSVNSSYARRKGDDSGRETLTSPSPPTKNGRSRDDLDSTDARHFSRSLNEGSRSRNSHERSDNYPAEEVDTLREDVSRIAQVICRQNETIINLESQMKQILAFQEKFLVHFLRKGGSMSKETQTDEVVQIGEGGGSRKSSLSGDKEPPNSHDNDSPKLKRRNSQRQMSQTQPRRSESDSKDISGGPAHPETQKSSMSGNNNKPPSNSNSTKIPVTKSPDGDPGGRTSAGTDKYTGDVSNILKNLQISNVQGPSMYSTGTSFKSIDFPQFNDDSLQNDNSCLGSPCIGPSASAYGSCSEDELESSETVVPSATFYNNLLSTVNRILDGGGKPTTSPPVSQPNTQEQGVSANPKMMRQTSNKNLHGNNVLAATASSRRESTTMSYTSGSSSDGSVKSDRNSNPTGQRKRNHCGDEENKENQGVYRGAAIPSAFPVQPNKTSGVKESAPAESVVDVTKKYLQSLGVQFDSPVPPPDNGNGKNYPPSSSSIQAQQQNYMIQQNVYNSIYIPTVNCVPVLTDSVNSNSGIMENLAHKYIPSSEHNQYEMLQNKNPGSDGIIDTTVYGMTPNNLSFATKQYLQRYGLVGQSMAIQSIPEAQPVPSSAQNTQPRGSVPYTSGAYAMANDRILDITAIKNQPKLL